MSGITPLDGCGTYFSSVDIIGGPGCGLVTLNPTIGNGIALSDRQSIEAELYIEATRALKPLTVVSGVQTYATTQWIWVLSLVFTT